jgi:hypothetical protein
MSNDRTIATREESQPLDRPAPLDFSKLPPEIVARAAGIAADVMASGGAITPAGALAAAYHFVTTGEIAGRDSYVVNGKVFEGYRAVTRRLDMSRYQYRYRPLTDEEKEWNGIEPSWQALICELDVLKARRQCILANIPYQPILGLGILKPQDKLTSSGAKKDPPKTKTWYWVLCKRARVDALRQAGENVSAEEVLEEAEAHGINVSVPEGARLTQEQAELVVENAEREQAISGAPAGDGNGHDVDPDAKLEAMSAEAIRERFTKLVAGQPLRGEATMQVRNQAKRDLIFLIPDAGNVEDARRRRHALTEFLLGTSDSPRWTTEQCTAISMWIDAQKLGDDWLPSQRSFNESKVILNAQPTLLAEAPA